MRRPNLPIALGLPMLLLSGCLFSPRSPESGGAEVCYESISPNLVTELFFNLNESIKCLQQSSYEDQLDETFVFIPTAGAAASFPAVFADDWDLERESEFVSQLFTTSQSIDVDLRIDDINENGDPDVGPNYIVTATYEMTVTDSGGGATVYEGQAEYTLEKISTNWVMTRWEDQETGQVSIGDLRGALAGG